MKLQLEELRSLMHQPEWSIHDRAKLLNLLKTKAQNHPEEYALEWKPYLSGFPHHFEEPLAEFESVDAFQKVAEWIPCGKFALNLHGQVLDSQTIEQLVTSPCCASLHSLNLSHTRIGHAEFKRLVTSPYLSCLESLDVSINTLGIPGMDALAHHSLTSLKNLNIARCYISDEGFQKLRSSSLMNQLHTINMSYNRISRQEAQAFIESESCSTIAHLIWEDLVLSTQGWLALATSGHVSALRTFDAPVKYRPRTSRAILLKAFKSATTLHPDVKQYILNHFT